MKEKIDQRYVLTAKNFINNGAKVYLFFSRIKSKSYQVIIPAKKNRLSLGIKSSREIELHKAENLKKK